jgi:hypothetical protein
MSFRKRPLLIVCSEQWKTRPGDAGGHRFVPGTVRVATSYYVVPLSCSDCMFSCYQSCAEIMFGLSSLWSFNLSPSTTFHTVVIFRTKFVSQSVYDDIIDMFPLLKEGRISLLQPRYNCFPVQRYVTGLSVHAFLKAPIADETEE